MSETDWTDIENDLVVSDYFAMLTDELTGKQYNKADHNRHLQKLLPIRNRGSIEFKHQNISAVLLGLGQPWINGYKPRASFQNSLVDAVLRWLENKDDWLNAKTESVGLKSSVEEAKTLWIGPPPTFANEPAPLDTEFMADLGRKYDVAARDARNRTLGKAGEERILAHEIASLRQASRNDLAARVQWTSVEEGDGYGYDISSFEPDGNERLIEVKTTNGWERTPFHISRNELAIAEERRDTWHLVRLWSFAREPKAFSIRPPLDAHQLSCFYQIVETVAQWLRSSGKNLNIRVSVDGIAKLYEAKSRINPVRAFEPLGLGAGITSQRVPCGPRFAVSSDFSGTHQFAQSQLDRVSIRAGCFGNLHDVLAIMGV
ncbi:MAG: DUF3883 domain-containing protein [Sphingorhabdus sp.]